MVDAHCIHDFPYSFYFLDKFAFTSEEMCTRSVTSSASSSAAAAAAAAAALFACQIVPCRNLFCAVFLFSQPEFFLFPG